MGGGQSAVEAAAYALRAGAKVTLLIRGELHWFAERRPRGDQPLRWWAYRLAYPEQGIGPPLINRLVSRPDLYASLPGPTPASGASPASPSDTRLPAGPVASLDPSQGCGRAIFICVQGLRGGREHFAGVAAVQRVYMDVALAKLAVHG